MPLEVRDDFARAELESFVRTFPYLEFRRYRSVNSRSDQRVLLNTLLHDTTRSVRACISRIDHRLAGLAVLYPLEWDTAFFGQPMAALRLLVGPQRRRQVATALLEKVLGSPHDAMHTTLRLDAEDFDVRIAAEERGFRIMDTLCTYEYHPKYSDLPKVLSQKYDVRRYEPRDQASVLDIAERCFAGYQNRLCLDPTIGQEKAQRFYRAWAEKCCSGELADQMLVAEHHGRVIGFVGWRLHPALLTHAGVRLHGAGLGGCVPTRFNAYRELLWHAVRSLGGDSADFDTHLFNVATINVYQRLGLSFVKARHTLHLVE